MAETWHPSLNGATPGDASSGDQVKPDPGNLPTAEQPPAGDGGPAPEPQNAAPASTPAAPAEQTQSHTEPQTTAPEQAPQPPSPPEAPPSQQAFDPNKYILIDRQNMYRDIAKHFGSDEEFRRNASTAAGRRAKQEYEERLQALEEQNADYRRQLRLNEVASMSQEEIQQRIQQDPEFAREYPSLIHPDETAAQERAERAEIRYYENERDNLFDQARAAGMPEERIRQYDGAFSYCPKHNTSDHGFFDHDENDRPYSEQFKDDQLIRRAGFDRFRNLIVSETARAQVLARQARTEQSKPEQTPPAPTGEATPPAPPAPPQEAQQTPPQQEATPPASPATPVPPANPNLVGHKPDTSGQNSRGENSPVKYTRDEVAAMNPLQRLELWPNQGDYERAIARGEIDVPALKELNSN